MADLEGRVAWVTGASRGIGRGVALGLAEAGATLYLTGRTLKEGDAELPGSLESTAAVVSELGGEARVVQCDHCRDDQVAAVFRQICDEQGRLDVLASCVWDGYKRMDSFYGQPFWEQPSSRWDDMFQAGARAAYVASAHAAGSMVKRRAGLIVHLSSWAAQKYLGNVVYGTSKAATDKMVSDMAVELRPHGVAAVSLYPGLVRTENVMRYAEHFDLTGSESPLFLGRVVAAMASDPKVLDLSGQVLVAAELARRYGVSDIDGSQPRPWTIDDV